MTYGFSQGMPWQHRRYTFLSRQRLQGGQSLPRRSGIEDRGRATWSAAETRPAPPGPDGVLGDSGPPVDVADVMTVAAFSKNVAVEVAETLFEIIFD